MFSFNSKKNHVKLKDSIVGNIFCIEQVVLPRCTFQGHPTTIFGKISVRKTI